MNTIPTSKLVPSVRISFHPVVGALHVADGVILRRFTRGGQIHLDVKATGGDGCGELWTIFPEDAISITPGPARWSFYTVTLRFQFPAWDEKDGIPFNVEATSKAHAIREARRIASKDGHLYGGKGRVSFRAIEDGGE